MESPEWEEFDVIFSFTIDSQVRQNLPYDWHEFEAMSTETTSNQNAPMVWKSINNEVSIRGSGEEASSVLDHLPLARWNDYFWLFLEGSDLLVCYFFYLVGTENFCINAWSIASHTSKFDSGWSNFWTSSMTENHLPLILK